MANEAASPFFMVNGVARGGVEQWLLFSTDSFNGEVAGDGAGDAAGEAVGEGFGL